MSDVSVWSLLLVLIVGVLLGGGAVWAVMRERVRAASSTGGADVEALAARAVQASSAQLLTLASERFERDSARREAAESQRAQQLAHTLSPISHTLQTLERSVARTHEWRAKADGSLNEQLADLRRHTERLDVSTHQLVAALKAPTSRGQWGEVQLRRIVEAAGMLEHTDFSQQATSRNAEGSAQRPDLVIHLSHGRTIVVDAKAPMDAYLRAVQASDGKERARLLNEHARALRSHVNTLSSKAYWAALGDSPEFVVLFVPSDGLLAGALEADPALLDTAFRLDIVIASPATLMALLRTVAHTWRTDALNKDALAVLDAGRELHKRLTTFSTHLAKVGRHLESSVKAYNDAVGSYSARVIPSARSMEELHVTSTPLTEPTPITHLARNITPTHEADPSIETAGVETEHAAHDSHDMLKP